MEENKKIENENVNENPTPTGKTAELVPEKPGVLKSIGLFITAPFRWIGSKIKESPAATGIGVVLGGAAVYGVQEGIKFIAGKKAAGTGFIPADPPEIKIEDDNIPSNMS